uniref:Eukaryotic translation initiation factor 3 subunit D n=1 Tax=Trichuris muris TaxID=70415 RepID=A0A5S6QNB0_TRIMR
MHKTGSVVQLTHAHEMNNVESRPLLLKECLAKLSINPNGWGPMEVPETFRSLPYQEFDRFERINKIADWTSMPCKDERRYTTGANRQAAVSNQAYAYQQEEEDSLFQVVDNARTPKPAVTRGTKLRMAQQVRTSLISERRNQSQVSNKAAKHRERDRHSQLRHLQKQFQLRQRYSNHFVPQMKARQPSVQIRADWKVIQEFDLHRLQKLKLPSIEPGEDISNERYGTLEYYDRSYDRLSSRNEILLQRVHRIFFTVTTTDDPVIEKLSKNKMYTVFGTDVIIATLMTCNRSVYSWDVVIHRVGQKLFFDKRLASDLDYPTVSETATEPPQEEGNAINSPANLAMEAMYINQNFSQQVLKMGEEKYQFDHAEVPYANNESPIGNIASKGYRYRKWDLGNNIIMVCRCEHDGVMLGTDGSIQFLTIKAFNEWDHRIAGGIDWRSKIDTQRGAILATELKNNSCKLAKWTIQAMLAGSQYLKFGYISRIHPRDSSKHVVLGIQQFKTTEFAMQINLNMDTAWGILRCIIDKCLSLPPGKYLLMKDPNKPLLLLYKINAEAFEDEDIDEAITYAANPNDFLE